MPERLRFKDGKIIPISGPGENFQVLKTSTEQITRELQSGQIVCIFPEDKIKLDGQMGPFKAGVERMVRKTPATAVPMALTGLCGSFFSKKYGKPPSRPFQRFRARVHLHIGKPIPPEKVSAEVLPTVVNRLKQGGS